jgi:ABC-type multidrug transport system fused ATPase/permease subunit
MQLPTVKSFLPSWHVMYQTIVRHYVLLSAWFLSGIIQAFCGVGIPWLLKNMIDMALEQQDIYHLNKTGIIVVVLTVIYYLSTLLLGLIVSFLLQKGFFQLRKELYARTLEQPLSFSKSVKTGEVIFHIQQDTQLFEKSLNIILQSFLFDIFAVFGISVLMFLTNPGLFYWIAIFLVLSTVMTMILGKPILPLSKFLQKISAIFIAHLHDRLHGMRTIKSFGREQEEIRKLDELNQEVAKADFQLKRFDSLLSPISFILEIIGVVFVIWYGAILLLHHEITVGTLLAFLMYAEILAEPISHVVKYFEAGRTCVATTQRLGEFLQKLHEKDQPYFKGIAPYVKPKKIVFENLSFKYPSSHRLILHDIQLEACWGKVTTIVGKNGSGKSTLMDLLLGLQAPTEGKILLNGIPIDHFDERIWRQKIGILSQDGYLFNDTIANNIAYSQPQASLKELNQACQKAGVFNLITRFPEGMQTIVGEKGSLLSGGELQKIAIARILLYNPDIIIFDEPAAHLDTEAISELMTSLHYLAKNRLVFLIEHRLEMIKEFSDHIVLIDAGKVVACGNHQDLLATSPLYSKLFAKKQKGK